MRSDFTSHASNGAVRLAISRRSTFAGHKFAGCFSNRS